jgi:hypothetical protein
MFSDEVADGTSMKTSATRSKVRFIPGQDGLAEEEFKRRLTPMLKRSSVREAYYARVDYDAVDEPVPAVCLVGDSTEAQRVCTEIADIFTGVFQHAAPLDMLYITNDQRTELAYVCHPFYLHPGSAQA